MRPLGNGAGPYGAGGGVWYGAGPSGYWEGLSVSEAELHLFGRSLGSGVWVK